MHALKAFALPGHIIAAPEGVKFRALTAEFGDEPFVFRRCAYPGNIGTKGADDKAGNGRPVFQRAARRAVGKQATENITFGGRQPAVVGQDTGGGIIPRNHVPGDGFDDRRNGEGIQHPL